MGRDPTEIVNEVLARVPDWVRRDLSANTAAARKRAEETLSAMITAALAKNVEKDAAAG